MPSASDVDALAVVEDWYVTGGPSFYSPGALVA
jgi:hypothetical protein